VKILLLGARRGLRENNWKDAMADAGTRLGWDVTHIDAGPRPGVPGSAPTCEDVVTAAKGSDMLLWARTHGHQPNGDVAAMLRRIEDTGTVTVGLHLDLYWGIPRREVQIGVDPWWSAQHVFTADGGPHPWGKVNHHWCPPAMDQRFFGRGTFRHRFSHPAVFVGGLVPDIHGYHRRSLLTWARKKYGGGFAQYGMGKRTVWGPDLCDLYTSAGVALGDSAWAPHYWSDRVPNTLGRGGLLAHPRTPGMAEQGFTDDVMVLYDRFDFRGLAKRLDGLDTKTRRDMTGAALALMEERHMWTHRLRMIAEVTGCA
jgi:hypothetical protein